MHISNGNIKVKANIFNLPAIKTCKKGTECRGYCYARKAEKMYKQVLPCRNQNLKDSKKKSFIPGVVRTLARRKNKLVRIHESGDFYSVAYFMKWVRIAELLPEYKFFAYTKRDDILTSEILNARPDNFKLMYSLDGIFRNSERVMKGAGKDIEKRHIQYGYNGVSIIVESFSTCPAQKNKDIKCGRDCKKCVNGKTVFFKVH